MTVRSRDLACTVVAAVLLAQPAHARAQAAPVTDADPRVSTADAVDEGLFASINGIDQWITIRGRDRHNPVLLILHGGPGFAMSGQAPVFFDWEKDFTIVQWDQPGGGATYAKNHGKDIGPLTLDRYARDGIAVTEFVRHRLGVQKVVLFGVSWGTQVGLVMAKRRPDLFLAYVGTGQVVSGPRGTLLGYELALDAARTRQDTKAIEALTRVGPPPYKSFEEFAVRQQYTNPPGLPPSPAAVAAYATIAKKMAAAPPNPRYKGPELSSADATAAFVTTQHAIYPELVSFEARDLGMTYSIPIFVFQGEDDINTPTVLAREFVQQIEAPAKAFVTIPGAGHVTTAFPAELLELLRAYVLPTARGSAR